MASFYATVVPNSATGGNGTPAAQPGAPSTPSSGAAPSSPTPTTAGVPKHFVTPPRLKVDSYVMSVRFNHDAWWGDMLDTQEYDLQWGDDSGGQSRQVMKAFAPKPWINPPLFTREEFSTDATWGPTGVGITTTLASSDGVQRGPFSGTKPRPLVSPYPTPDFVWEQADRYKDASEVIAGLNYPGVESKVVATSITLETGGRSGVNQRSLFSLFGRAFDTSNTDVTTSTPLNPFTHYDRLPEFAPPALKLMGQSLGNDGFLYRMLPDNAPITATLLAPGYPNYVFNLITTKHSLVVVANNRPLDPVTYLPNTTFPVGQKITFAYEFQPPLSAFYNFNQSPWMLSPKYVNNLKRDGPLPNKSNLYDIDPQKLLDPTTSVWYVNGAFAGKPSSAGVILDITFGNGQTVSLSSIGKFRIHRPNVELDPTSITPRNRYCGVNPPYHRLGLGEGEWFGNTGSEGMEFDVKVTTPVIGNAGITQLVILNYSGFPQLLKSFNDWRLDGSKLASDEFYVESTPINYGALKLTLQDQPSNESGLPVRLEAYYVDYIRFRPNGDDNIYATLGRIIWNTHAELSATVSPGGYILNFISDPDPTDPDGSDELPVWEKSWP